MKNIPQKEGEWNGMAMQNIEVLEKRLWEAAIQLRANSDLGYNEYLMPVLVYLSPRYTITINDFDYSIWSQV
jgi:hypothetical protein